MMILYRYLRVKQRVVEDFVNLTFMKMLIWMCVPTMFILRLEQVGTCCGLCRVSQKPDYYCNDFVYCQPVTVITTIKVEGRLFDRSEHE